MAQTTNGDSQPATEPSPQSPPHPAPRIGPHPGFVSSSNQYSSEIKIRRLLRNNGCDPAREDVYRLQGVQLIDNVREHLQLPVRTFDTAATYFHKFRLNFRDAEYNYQDAALASLFVACKVEDTIKKSRDILAAAYNIRNPDKPTSPDDKIFDSSSKVIIGLERLILETIGFDFRTRYPQKMLVKIIRATLGHGPAAKSFLSTAYAMSIDLYKTFVPIKRTTLAMALAVVQLTARLGADSSSSVADRLDRIDRFTTTRFAASPNASSLLHDAVTESMLDLLDLYVQHHKSTRLGTHFDLARFIDIKIRLNNDLDASASPRHLFHCARCDVADAEPLVAMSVSAAEPISLESSTASAWPPDAAVRRTARAHDGTMRFVFDPTAAHLEHNAAADFFRQEYHEYEIEVEEALPLPQERDPAPALGPRGGYRGGHRDRGDHRRGGPYGGYRGDRNHRGRGRFY